MARAQTGSRSRASTESGRERAGDRRATLSAQAPRTSATRGQAGKRPRQQAWLAIAALLLVLGLVGWWAFAPLGGRLRPGEAGAAQSIAQLDAPDVHALLIDPTNPDRVLFGSHAGIQESRDGGYSWEQGSLADADAMSLVVSPADPSTLYVAGHDVFLASKDGGESWQPVRHDLPGTDLHGFAQDPKNALRLYALVVGVGIMTSADGGTTWAPLQGQPAGLGGHAALAADGGALYVATGEGLVVTRDGGATWEQLATPPGGTALSLALAGGAPPTIYVGAESGLAKSADGGRTWGQLGLGGVPALALAVAPSDPNRVLVVNPAGAVFRSDDGGATWESPR